MTAKHSFFLLICYVTDITESVHGLPLLYLCYKYSKGYYLGIEFNALYPVIATCGPGGCCLAKVQKKCKQLSVQIVEIHMLFICISEFLPTTFRH